MNTKKKLAIVCPLVAIFLIVAFYVLPSLQVGPSSVKIVIAEGGFDNTEIKDITLKVWEDSTYRNVSFTDNNQVRYAEVDESIEFFTGEIWLGKNYANNPAEAVAYTRVHIILKNPSDETVFSAYASTGPEGWVIDQGDYWEVPYIAYSSPYIDLVEGTYTLTTKYEIYA